jgi:predicted alpha/beta superfamily hydrolase
MRGETMKRLLLTLLLPFLLLSLAVPAAAEERKPSAGPGVHVLAPMTIPGLGRERPIRIYLPPGYEAGAARYPVLYMHDGQNLFDDVTSYVGEWGVDEAMDQLARDKGLEVIVVGIDHGGDRRINELSPWANPQFGAAEGREYMRFVVEVVKPYIDSHYRTRPGRDDTGIMGSSMGGLASHFAAFEYPQVFGRIGIFSPSYWFAPAVYELSRQQRLPAHTRMFMVVGDHEGSNPREAQQTVDNAVRMAAELRLQQPGLRLRAKVIAGGEHNERAWQKQFPEAMQFLFGPQAR